MFKFLTLQRYKLWSQMLLVGNVSITGSIKIIQLAH